MARITVGKKTVHHMDFDTLVEVNKQVVTLTGEPHEFSASDKRKLSELVEEVELRADNQDFEEAVAEKASLLIFKVASGQYFRGGNKRTALVAGLAFLKKNGYSIDIENPEFVSTVDKVGIAASTLDDLYSVVLRLAKKSPAERKGWEKAVQAEVDSHKDFLTKVGS
jgi:prophage maintenance system killer protein